MDRALSCKPSQNPSSTTEDLLQHNPAFEGSIRGLFAFDYWYFSTNFAIFKSFLSIS